MSVIAACYGGNANKVLADPHSTKEDVAMSSTHKIVNDNLQAIGELAPDNLTAMHGTGQPVACVLHKWRSGSARWRS